MKANGWLLWVCLAIIFVSVPWLFYARMQAGAAQAESLDLKQQMSQLQAKLDEVEASTVSQENARLRAENQSYSQKLAKANNDLTRVTADKATLAGQLQTARLALSMQQNHLQELSTANQQAQAAAAAPPPPSLSADDARDLCVQHLQQILTAKAKWALDNNKGPADVPTAQDLAQYLNGGVMPTCPAGGTYTIGSMNDQPTCSVQGHALPVQQ